LEEEKGKKVLKTARKRRGFHQPKREGRYLLEQQGRTFLPQCAKKKGEPTMRSRRERGVPANPFCQGLPSIRGKESSLYLGRESQLKPGLF